MGAVAAPIQWYPRAAHHAGCRRQGSCGGSCHHRAWRESGSAAAAFFPWLRHHRAPRRTAAEPYCGRCTCARSPVSARVRRSLAALHASGRTAWLSLWDQYRTYLLQASVISFLAILRPRPKQLPLRGSIAKCPCWLQVRRFYSQVTISPHA